MGSGASYNTGADITVTGGLHNGRIGYEDFLNVISISDSGLYRNFSTLQNLDVFFRLFLHDILVFLVVLASHIMSPVNFE